MTRARRYSYSPRRGRSGRVGGWWLLLPALLVAALVFLGYSLPHGGGGIFVKEAACPAGQDCDASVAISGVSCASGGRCAGLPSDPRPLGDAYPPVITAPSAAVIEAPCGGVLYGLDLHAQRPPASITKIATALAVVDSVLLSDVVAVDVDGAEMALDTDSTVMGLQPGQRLSVRDLLYGLLLSSGNDAALALAEYAGGSVPAFVGLMNQEAARLGLTDTRFANPHGLDDPAHYTSAYDVAMLGRELLSRPQLAAIVDTATYRPAWDGPALWNSNRMLQLYPDSIGVKIGYTDAAGQTIVAAAERSGRRIIVSVLGSSDIYQDAIKLFEWAFGNAPSGCGG